MRIVLSSMLLFSLLIFNVDLAIPQTEQEPIQSVDNGRLGLLTNDIKAIKDVINRADRLGLIALIVSFMALILGAIGIWYAVGEVKSSAKQLDIGIQSLKMQKKAADLLTEKREHIETFCSVASESAKIISGAMTELKIATDVVAFGSINCRQEFEKEYFPALQKQFNRPEGEVKIEVVNFSHNKKARLAALQFPSDKVKQEKALETEKACIKVLTSLCC